MHARLLRPCHPSPLIHTAPFLIKATLSLILGNRELATIL